MDAETQVVFDAAWNIVDFDSLAVGDGSSARRSLIAALQAHAKAHPPELHSRPKRREPLVIREPLGQAGSDVIIGGQGMPTPPGYGPTPPPREGRRQR